MAVTDSSSANGAIIECVYTSWRRLGVNFTGASSLVGRGLLLRQRQGVRQELRLSPLSTAALTVGSLARRTESQKAF